MIVTMLEAKTQLSKLVAAALRGEEVVIARGDTPAVRLVPVQPVVERKPGRLKGQIGWDERFWDPLPDEELRAWGML